MVLRSAVVCAVWLAVLSLASPVLADVPSHAETMRAAVRPPAPQPVAAGVSAVTQGPPGTAATVADAAPVAGRSQDWAARRPTVAAMPAPTAGDPMRGILAVERGLRVIFAAAAFSAIGVLVFVFTVWDGSSRELDLLCRVAEWASLAAAVIVVIQVVARAALTAGGWLGAIDVLPGVLASSYGVGMALRGAGLALLSIGARTMRRAPTAPLPAICAAALVVGSFALAGYAAGEPPRLVSAFALVAHVAAVAAWGGGLLALVITLRDRRQARVPLRAGYVAARFSVVATLAVALAAIAGFALTFITLESIGALWTTTYGLLLVAKVMLVAVVAGIGAYNHYVVVPVLRVVPDHAIGRRLHRLGSIEILLFAAVITVNSTLVGVGG